MFISQVPKFPHDIFVQTRVDDMQAVHQLIDDVTQAKPVYAQLLHSSLDADLLDYLLRDSRQAGVSFGNVELEYILRQLRIKKCKLRRDSGIEDDATIELVVFDIRGQHAIEHFLMARYFHYTQVIQHKTSIAFEAAAKALVYKVLRNTSTPYADYDAITACIGKDDFYQYTDDFLWETIRKECMSSSDAYIKTLWECVSQRKKPVHVLTLTDIIPKKSVNSKEKPVNDPVYFLTNGWFKIHLVIWPKQQESIRHSSVMWNPPYI